LAALKAIRDIERPEKSAEQLSRRFVALLVHLFRHDEDSRLREQALELFVSSRETSPEAHAALRDGLVDRDDRVRQQAQVALMPQLLGGRRMLTFAEVDETSRRALGDTDAGVRQGAVQALNRFGAESYEYLPNLQEMAVGDSNPAVRESARLAIEAILREQSR